MERRPGSILTCCTNNALRSPMMEGIAKYLYGHVIYVDSAGLRAGRLDPFAVAVMDEIGVDISGHRPKSFDDLEDSSFDLVVSLSPEAQHRAVEMTRTTATELVFWNTFDPSFVEGNREIRLLAYRQVRDQLLARLMAYFKDKGWAIAAPNP